MKAITAIVALVMIVALPLPAGAERDVDQHAKKLQAMGELLDKSSLNKQVLNSDNEASVQYYKFAKSLYEQAVAAYHDGNIEKSEMLIKKSKNALFDAIEFSSLRQEKKEKERGNYEAMRRSVSALMDAMQRVGAEKGKNSHVEPVAEKAKKLIQQADQYYFSEHYREGTELLGKAMQGIKIAISEMRSGDTLTRTLTFADPKDEYQYELERNDTHFMLLDMFLAETPANADISRKIEGYIKTARESRKKAEDLASKSMHKNAVRQIENSTANVISAIRATGAYIPE
jgi:hypothetical protein